MQGETCPDSGHPALGSPPRGRRLLARPGTGASSERFGQRQKSCAAGTPRAGDCQGAAAGGQGRGGRDPITQPPRPARHSAVLCCLLSCPVLPPSLPLLCPVPGSPGGGARGAAGGAAGGSGAAFAHAPGPGAVQLPRPQLALLRARPCTSLLNWPGGVARRRWRSRPPQAPPPQAPPFRATFGFFFRRGARREPQELDLFHTLGDPSRATPSLIQLHTRPRTPPSRALVPPLDPLSLGWPFRTWSPHLCPHYHPRSQISAAKPFRVFWTGPNASLFAARQVPQHRSLVDLCPLLSLSQTPPRPNLGSCLQIRRRTWPLGAAPPVACPPPPAAPNPQAAAPAPLLACRCPWSWLGLPRKRWPDHRLRRNPSEAREGRLDRGSEFLGNRAGPSRSRRQSWLALPAGEQLEKLRPWGKGYDLQRLVDGELWTSVPSCLILGRGMAGHLQTHFEAQQKDSSLM